MSNIIALAALSCVAISSVAAYNYQVVGKCPNILGDPSFSTDPFPTTRGIYATSYRKDSLTDSCAIIKAGTFYVTGTDSSFSIYKFKSKNDLAQGTFTQVGPDGETYRVIALKSYGPECGYMNLLLRCSDSVGNYYNAPQVKIHGNVFEPLNSNCLRDAESYATKVLGQEIKLSVLQNKDCQNLNDYCQKTDFVKLL